MVYATLTEEMLRLLKDLKFSDFISYEGAKTSNTFYGNLRIHTDKRSIELCNIERTMPFFDISEDIACLECKLSDPTVTFKPHSTEPFEVFEMGGRIESIEIINDKIDVNDGEYEISFDRAIIFRTNEKCIMFSRGVWFSEVIMIYENDDYDVVYPVDEVIEAWSNDGENKVEVTRSRREL